MVTFHWAEVGRLEVPFGSVKVTEMELSSSQEHFDQTDEVPKSEHNEHV